MVTTFIIVVCIEFDKKMIGATEPVTINVSIYSQIVAFPVKRSNIIKTEIFAHAYKNVSLLIQFNNSSFSKKLERSHCFLTL